MNDERRRACSFPQTFVRIGPFVTQETISPPLPRDTKKTHVIEMAHKRVHGLDHVVLEVGVLESVEALPKGKFRDNVECHTTPAAEHIDRLARFRQLLNMPEEDAQLLGYQGM
jgi:hypothetical protein